MSAKSKQAERAILHRAELGRHLRTVTSKQKLKRKRRRGTRAHFESQFALKKPLRGVKTDDSYNNLQVPETLDLQNDFETIATFVHDIRKIALGEKRPVRLVFDVTKTIRPAALLLLLAEIHRCRLIHGPVKVTGTHPIEKKIERMLQETGFFKILGVVPKTKYASRTYPLEYIEFASESRITQGTAKNLRQELFGDTITIAPQARRQLTRAINEAMLNAGQHAYPQDSLSNHPEQGRWWLSGHFNKKRGELTVMFCDLGVGIPKTLPKRYPMEVIMSVLALLPGIKPNDGEMIHAGMAIGRTRTQEENRGKGLNDLRRFIEEAGAGELHIYSRRGHYCYMANGKERVHNYSTSIGGTLIQWTVPLEKISNWSHEVVENENQDD